MRRRLEPVVAVPLGDHPEEVPDVDVAAVRRHADGAEVPVHAREETALGELIQPIEQAIERGADAMVTPCPLCHLSLDAWQQKLEAATGRKLAMPILHLSQLIGVAAGLEDSELQFKRHVVSVAPMVEKLEV